MPARPICCKAARGASVILRVVVVEHFALTLKATGHEFQSQSLSCLPAPDEETMDPSKAHAATSTRSGRKDVTVEKRKVVPPNLLAKLAPDTVPSAFSELQQNTGEGRLGSSCWRQGYGHSCRTYVQRKWRPVHTGLSVPPLYGVAAGE